MGSDFPGYAFAREIDYG